ncbi:ThiF family adenylyltransferase [Microbacterium sp. BK668]|uniref:ThiF family adenylyltransferase n=1 Tax=Microbacterium sp. BK668 TaxID=2512118 RepID=UPI0010615D5C|nr:ThiF family adenylyltransferase [Microbacterium sp. BK668]TDN92004.1 adenylyltransferase/sulfurtransferase [Microbacterium sp. BK668]
MPLPPLVEPVAVLGDLERVRTARHARLAGFGEIAQRRLAAARVAVVGAGGLGSPVVLALAAAGVGEIVVIDDDVVELSNLQRQILHRLGDLGAPKVDSAVRAAGDLAPDTLVRPIRERLTSSSAARILADAHLVIDGTDTFETREAVASGCEELGVPLVWGSVQGFDAQVTVFWNRPPRGFSPVVLADLYPSGSVGDVPSCADVGVLGALCMQVGALLATEAIKLVTGVGETLLGRVLVVDGLRARQHEVPLRTSMTDATAVPPPGEPAPVVPFVGPAALAGALIVDVREDAEVQSGMIPGSRHIPLGVLLADPAMLTGSGRVVIVCQVGLRARRAAEALRRAGVDAEVLAGGIDAWRASTAARMTA